MEKQIKQISILKVGGFVIFDDKACRITDIQTSKTGKHGHAKSRISAVSLIGNSKTVKVYPSHDKLEVPIIEKESAQILSIQGDLANVMDAKTYETFDLKISKGLKDNIKEGDQVSYWIIMGQKVMMKSK
jgi:translation initiation factor 5A